MDIPPPSMEMGQLAKKLWWKEKWMDGRLLAKLLSYRCGGKNSTFDLDMRTGWG
jgi:hypothetical protein